MKKKALIIGGSGGLSGRLAALAKDEYEVWAVTRGQRPLGDGIHLLKADRNDTENFRKTILEADTNWDIVFDCICMNERHALQDLDVLPGITKRLVVISTDSVYDPLRKDTPQNEDGYFVEEEGEPEALTYAGNKRRMEHIFINNFNTSLAVTLLRPGHIYGPGFLIGCYPEHSRQKNCPSSSWTGSPFLLLAAESISRSQYLWTIWQTPCSTVQKGKALLTVFSVSVDQKQWKTADITRSLDSCLTGT